MRVCIGQINTTPGDFEGNLNKIIDAFDTGLKNSVDLVVTPELGIPGYLSRDLMFSDSYIKANLDHFHRLVSYTGQFSEDITLVVGYIDYNTSGVGKPFRNVAAAINRGRVVGAYYKRLIPFDDVFDEGRYFEPGSDLCVLRLGGDKWGLCICEDLWNDKNMTDYKYEDNPVQKYRDLGINNLVSINSSPFIQLKPTIRASMLRSVAREGQLIYCNQVGGQDDLVFDGHSTYICNGVACHISSDMLKDTYEVFETYSGYSTPSPCDQSRFGFDSDRILHDALVVGLRDYVRKSGFNEVVLGSSGGVDSALVAALACEALGPENVTCLMMPSVYSSEGSVKDAEELHRRLGCREHKVPIDHLSFMRHVIGSVGDIGKTRHPVAEENMQARLRGMIVMDYSNSYGAFPLTTGNKTELAVGYFTVFGDSAGGFACISDLYKGEVKSMVKYINKNKGDIIPESILTKAPSAELAPGQTDEKSLLPYNILDQIVKDYIENHVETFDEYKFKRNKNPFIGKDGAREAYNRIIAMINRNEFKRRLAPPGIKVSKVAFGTGRRIPVVMKRSSR